MTVMPREVMSARELQGRMCVCGGEGERGVQKTETVDKYVEAFKHWAARAIDNAMLSTVTSP